MVDNLTKESEDFLFGRQFGGGRGRKANLVYARERLGIEVLDVWLHLSVPSSLRNKGSSGLGKHPTLLFHCSKLRFLSSSFLFVLFCIFTCMETKAPHEPSLPSPVCLHVRSRQSVNLFERNLEGWFPISLVVAVIILTQNTLQPWLKISLFLLLQADGFGSSLCLLFFAHRPNQWKVFFLSPQAAFRILNIANCLCMCLRRWRYFYFAFFAYVQIKKSLFGSCRLSVRVSVLVNH